MKGMVLQPANGRLRHLAEPLCDQSAEAIDVSAALERKSPLGESPAAADAQRAQCVPDLRPCACRLWQRESVYPRPVPRCTTNNAGLQLCVGTGLPSLFFAFLDNRPQVSSSTSTPKDSAGGADSGEKASHLLTPLRLSLSPRPSAAP